jgi:uncharacterized protein YqeY
MNTQEKLHEALKQAMRDRDDTRKATLRMALSAIRNAEIEKRGSLDEPEVLGILQKEVKSRRETIDEARQAGREDLAQEAEQEIAILETFLPQPLSQEELEKMTQEAIADVGASSPQEIGQVMKVLMPRIRGRADGSEASRIVRRLLS